MADSNRAPISVFGTGGHAKVVADIVRCSVAFRISEFVDLAPRGDFLGRPVVSFADWVPAEGGLAFVAIGDNAKRESVVGEILAARPAMKFATLIHPSAVIAADASVGEGSVVMAGACINSGTRIADHCVVNTRSSLDHDNSMESFSTVAPGAVTGGGVHIGRLAWLGLGAMVLEGRRIGANSLIGAGSLVNRDVPENLHGFGVPWREKRKRSRDGRAR